MADPLPETVFIVKYALSSGVFEIPGTLCSKGSTSDALYFRSSPSGYLQHASPGEYAFSRPDAARLILAKIRRERLSIEKKLKKLKGIEAREQEILAEEFEQ